MMIPHSSDVELLENTDVEPQKLRIRPVSGECNEALLTAAYNHPTRREYELREFPRNEIVLRNTL